MHFFLIFSDSFDRTSGYRIQTVFHFGKQQLKRDSNFSLKSTRIEVTDWKTLEGLDSGRQGDKGDA